MMHHLFHKHGLPFARNGSALLRLPALYKHQSVPKVTRASQASRRCFGSATGEEVEVEVDRSEGDVNLTHARTAWQAENLDEKTKALLEEDSQYFLHQSLSTPCLNAMQRCYDIYIEDVQGRRYMDFHGNSVHQVGFSNPAVVEAITRQLTELSFCTRRYTNQPAVALAKKLVEHAPGDLSRVLFTPGGASSIGVALKLARMATGRHKTISMWDSFHGASLDAISLGGESIFRKGVGPLLTGCSHVPPADEFRCVFGCNRPPSNGCDLRCADYIEYIMEKEGDVCAVVAEPIRWTPYIPRKEYWQQVRAACDKHGALLIMDEIPNSLGRTGNGLYTHAMFDIVPDMVVLGKGLGGGILPLSAVVVRENLNEVCKTAAIGHYTHEKNPVSCAAGLATLEYIEEHRLVENARVMGEVAMECMRALKEKYEAIGDVRGQGLLLGIELVKDRVTKERDNDAAEFIMYAALSRGLSFKLTMGNVISLCPPLIITEEQLREAFDILDQCFAELEGQTQKQ